MGQCLDPPGADFGQAAVDINSGRGEQCATKSLCRVERCRGIVVQLVIAHQSAHQRITVGMNTTGGETKQNIAGIDIFVG